MPGELEVLAIRRLIDRAVQLGVGDQVPQLLQDLADGCGPGNGGAILWSNAHPNDPGTGCCAGEAAKGLEYCTCWVPRFDVEQAPPVMPQRPEDITVRPAMCGDCAYRPGSPERADGYTEETLLSLPEDGEMFYCHDGMRRPTHWEHPDGRTIPGDPSDWQPPRVRGVPFRADGRTGMLCAGWAARARRADHIQQKGS